MRVVQKGTGRGGFTLYDLEPTPDRICEDVAAGLATPQKTLPPKYFYDERGAKLFERITALADYYPTKTELAILREHAAEIAEALGPAVRLIEFGSGSGEKTWVVLEHLDRPAAYIPIDISRAQLEEFAREVARSYPDLPVAAICADYMSSFELPDLAPAARRSVAFFPGSTIGNLEPSEAEAFLRTTRRLVGPEGGMLLGVDLWKDPEVIRRAYNDPEEVTAEFNLNLLRRINEECGANFDLAGFRHDAVLDPDHGRVEMRLVSRRPQTVRLRPDPDLASAVEVAFAEGEHIITEYSHKYRLEEFAELAARAGWAISRRWSDPREWFAVVLLN